MSPIIQAGVFDEDENEVIFGRVDVVGLFALAKRKGLFSGEGILKENFTFKRGSDTIAGSNTMEISGVRGSRTGMMGMTGSGYELPVSTKFLLVAAFLASYNPTKDDARIFSRDSGLKKRRKRAGHKSNKGIAKVYYHVIPVFYHHVVLPRKYLPSFLFPLDASFASRFRYRLGVIPPQCDTSVISLDLTFRCHND